MNHIDKSGLLLLIVAIPLMFAVVFFTTHKKPENDAVLANTTSMVELDYALLKESLNDSCILKGEKLRVTESLAGPLMMGVDSTAVKRNGNILLLDKKGAYVTMPAALLANMVDMGLLKDHSVENEQ